MPWPFVSESTTQLTALELILLPCHVRAQPLQHGEELWVQCRRSTLMSVRGVTVRIREVTVKHNHELSRRLHEPAAACRQLKQSVALHVLAQITGKDSLAYNRIPHVVRLVLTIAELLKLVVLV